MIQTLYIHSFPVLCNTPLSSQTSSLHKDQIPLQPFQSSNASIVSLIHGVVAMHRGVLGWGGVRCSRACRSSAAKHLGALFEMITCVMQSSVYKVSLLLSYRCSIQPKSASKSASSSPHPTLLFAPSPAPGSPSSYTPHNKTPHNSPLCSGAVSFVLPTSG